MTIHNCGSYDCSGSRRRSHSHSRNVSTANADAAGGGGAGADGGGCRGGGWLQIRCVCLGVALILPFLLRFWCNQEAGFRRVLLQVPTCAARRRLKNRMDTRWCDCCLLSSQPSNRRVGTKYRRPRSVKGSKGIHLRITMLGP